MSDIDITLYFDKREVSALQDALSDEGCTVEQKLREAFDFFYTELVPPERQLAIEEEILKEDIERQKEIEAKKRFGLFHIRENGADRYFLSEYILHPVAAAYRYRLYARNELSAEPKCFADAFLESVPMTAEDYDALTENLEIERKILSVSDFDLDEGEVCFTDSDGSRSYTLQDVSAAAYKAYRSLRHSVDNKTELFEDALDGKELRQDEPNMTL